MEYWKTMRSIIYSTIILAGFCLALTASKAATVYLWTDAHGRMHITDEKPSEGAAVRDVIEYEPGPAPPAREPPPESGLETEKEAETEALCRNLFEARRTLRKINAVAAAVRQQAEEARDKVQNLRRRIGFDDDRREEFKYDLKRLEEDARRKEMFAQQTELDVRMAELQVQFAESEAEEQCADKGKF